LVISTYPLVNGIVQEAVADGSGGWFIAGDFTKVGAETRIGLAHILQNGTVDTNWSADLSARHISFSYGFKPDLATLYIGGDFTSVDGANRAAVAAVNASTGNVEPWDPNCDGIIAGLGN
jgi:hypothetical protein